MTARLVKRHVPPAICSTIILSYKHFVRGNFPRAVGVKKRPPFRMSFARRGVEKQLFQYLARAGTQWSAKSGRSTRAVTETSAAVRKFGEDMKDTRVKFNSCYCLLR